MAILTWLGVPGKAGDWEALGFVVEDGTTRIGRVVHTLGTEPSWGFDELCADPAALGVPTRSEPGGGEPGRHPNGIDRVDHVVYAVPSLDPAVDALEAVLGEGPRRRSRPRGEAGPEMAFFRVGEGFIEVVASATPERSGGPTAAPALWGIAFGSPDLDATVAAIRAAGGPVGDPKPAVQGGRIASVWKEHVGWGIAIMEPPSTQT